MEEKWDKLYVGKNCNEAVACDALRENIHLLPQSSGNALDLACGMGGNAILLAKESKLTVNAWDISSVAINKLSDYVRANNLNITAHVRDVEQYYPGNPPPTLSDISKPQDCPSIDETFDVITVSYFLHRPTFKSLLDALKPKGILFYQTLIKDKTDPDIGPSNPKFLLDKNELLHLCKDLEVLVYREEGTTGCITQGWRNSAMIIAKKL